MASIGAQARFNDFSFIIGGAVVRNQLYLRFPRQRHGRRHSRRQPAARHAACRHHHGGRPRLSSAARAAKCSSRCSTSESRGVFQGKIIVKPHAQKTDGKMMSQALLLSEDAEMDNKPELEIFADDVQCGHGATCGDLDEDLLFYLSARGIPPGRGRVAADSGVRRRGGGGDRACAAARGADGAGGGVAGGEGMMHPAVTNGSYDVDRIRADFPALAMQVYGKPLVYLDNAASAQKPQAVLDRLQRAYTAQYANVHRGLHYLANEATEAYEGARETVRGLSQRRARRKRSSSPATPPRRSTSSPIRSAASASRQATRSCSRSWSTIPTSCRGISCASARAR